MRNLTITGGRVYDPETNTIANGDVAFVDGVLAQQGAVDAEIIDAAGQLVAPGFIDLHTHIFSHKLFTHSRLEADRIGVRQGVACLVDAGSSGAMTIDAFPENVHQTQKTQCYAFINIGSPGLPNLGGGHASRPELIDLDGVVKAFERHSDWLVGVKVLASQSHTGSFGLEAVKLARKAAHLVNKPLMLHIGNAPPVVDDVLALLDEGDIVTHTYHGKTGGVLGYQNKVIDAFRDAVERGVIVDLGHGRSSFSFGVWEAARDQGMPLHCISSDLHRGNVDRYAVSLPRTMTKLLNLGLTLEQILERVTINPARAVAIDEFGFGTWATDKSISATILEETEEPMQLEDAEGATLTVEHGIRTTGCVLNGQYHSVTEPL